MKMVRKLVLFFFVVAINAASSYGQVDRKLSIFKIDKTDLGIGLGTTFYLGDFNSVPFTYPRYYASIHHRYSFDLLYALRTSVAIGKVAGGVNSNNLNMPFYTEKFQDQGGFDVRFERMFVDFSTGVEIGLAPFDAVLHRLKSRVAPYIFLGVGILLAYPDKHRDNQEALLAMKAYPEVYGTKDENASSIQSFNIPIGLGVKWTPAKRWTFAFEWQFKKTFTDKIDRFNNPQGSKLMNTDWVSLFGVTLSYRLMPAHKCPAVVKYKPERKELKGINTSYKDTKKKK